MAETVDPLASPTLAQLYLAQGHLGKARRVLRTLLQREPHHGQALALLDRLQLHATASLQIDECDDRDADRGQDDVQPRLTVRWRVRMDHVTGAARAEMRDTLSVVQVTHQRRQPGTPLCTRVTSFRCAQDQGERELGRPDGTASATFALACLRGGRLQVLAYSQPLSWSEI